MKQSVIATNFSISKGAVSKILRKYCELHTVRTASKPGRPKKTTSRIDKFIINSSKANSKKTSRELNEEVREKFGINVTNRTIQYRLIAEGLIRRVATKKPLLSK